MGSNLYTGGIFVDGSLKNTPLHRLNEVSKSRPLHRRSIHAEFKPLHRLNEVSEKMAERLLHGRFCSLSRLWFKIEILSIPASTQAEYSCWVQTSTQVERSFQKMAERLLHGRFCSLSRLWFKIEILSIAAEPP
ncbi:hypothetical protein TNCV_3482631 [Trichonephila clavipes]|nr:hypothetical protein TNCV_3482631 [Trichonephila clavipes]